MGRWSRKYTAWIAISLLLICGSFYRYRRSGSYGDVQYLDGEELVLDLGGSERHYPEPAPKITIIAIWNPGPSKPLYLPNFFASVAANPMLDVLFIKDDRHEVGCDERLAPGIDNIREVCLSSEDYWGLHADFLCERWGGCTELERETVVSKMYERRWGDRVHAYFRPFRHHVFRKWLNPATPIWGVCDMDTFLGNFERNFPWDEAEKYDLVFPGPPTDSDDVLIYIPGHLGFYKNSEHLTAEFMKLPQVRTFDGFLQQQWMDSGAPDEAEWSNWAFAHTDLTFLRFPGLVTGQYHFSQPGSGTFSIDNAGYWVHMNRLLEPENSLMRAALVYAMKEQAKKPRKALFSSQGEERQVTFREGKYEGFTWFPRSYAVDFLIPHELITQDWWQTKKFIIRRERGGPVTYRVEPMYSEDWFVLPPETYTHENPAYIGSPMLAYDSLYNHFQGEKYSEWWKSPGLPEHPLAENEVLYVNKDLGTWIWDDRGRILFTSTATKKD